MTSTSSSSSKSTSTSSAFRSRSKTPTASMVDGLLAQDFSIYEDNSKQTITFFTSDPFPLSAALVIDLGISETTLKKVASTYSALDGSFGPFDKVAVFTYGNTVQEAGGLRKHAAPAIVAAAHSRSARTESRLARRRWSLGFRTYHQRQAGRSRSASADQSNRHARVARAE